jgi:hypothetical protein
VGPPNEKKPRPTKEIATNIAQTLVAFANAALNSMQQYPSRFIHRELAKLCHFEPRRRHVACCHIFVPKFSWLFFAMLQAA